MLTEKKYFDDLSKAMQQRKHFATYGHKHAMCPQGYSKSLLFS